VIVLAIAAVGGLGAIARFLLDGAVSSQLGRVFPFGTLAVNLTGAFALGVLDGAGVGGNALRIAGVGFLGAYTTFSTWALEAHRLGEDGRMRLGLANLLVSLALGLGCAWLGRQVGLVL
jgi:fluoride exporter